MPKIVLNKAYNEIMSDMQQEAQEQYGMDFRVAENSDWYREHAPVALAVQRLYDKLQASIDNMRLRTAEDPSFFGQASNYMFFRKMPTAAKGILETSDSQVGATADIGEIKVRKANTDIIYSNTQLVTVNEVPFEVNFHCDTTGASGDAAIGEISEVVSAPPGWGSFSNPATFEGGQDLEDLEDGRKRFFNGGASKSYWNVDGIYAALMEISGVSSVKVKTNRTDTAIDGQPRRSVYCIIDGGSDSDIGRVLFEKVGQSAFMYGSTSVVVTNIQGDEETVKFDRPSNITVDKEVTVIGSGTTAEIEAAVDEYINSVSVGGVISSYYAEDYIKENVSSAANFDHIKVEFKKEETEEWVAAISLAQNEKAVAGVV